MIGFGPVSSNPVSALPAGAGGHGGTKVGGKPTHWAPYVVQAMIDRQRIDHELTREWWQEKARELLAARLMRMEEARTRQSQMKTALYSVLLSEL